MNSPPIEDSSRALLPGNRSPLCKISPLKPSLHFWFRSDGLMPHMPRVILHARLRYWPACEKTRKELLIRILFTLISALLFPAFFLFYPTRKESNFDCFFFAVYVRERKKFFDVDRSCFVLSDGLVREWCGSWSWIKWRSEDKPSRASFLRRLTWGESLKLKSFWAFSIMNFDLKCHWATLAARFAR